MDRRCQRQATGTGEQCKKWALKGSTLCRKHGGNNPHIKRKAKQRLAQQTVGAMLAKQGIELDAVDPLEILLEQLGMASGAAHAYGAMVRDLEGVTMASKFGLEPHVLIAMWNEERDRASRLAKMALDAGVDERQVRLAERQGALLHKVFILMLEDRMLGLTLEQRETGKKIAARHLRALGA